RRTAASFRVASGSPSRSGRPPHSRDTGSPRTRRAPFEHRTALRCGPVLRQAESISVVGNPASPWSVALGGRFEFLECGKDSVSPRVDTIRGEVAPSDDSLRIDHEERPRRFAVAFGEDAVCPGDGPFGVEIGEERKVQVAILRKRQMTPDSVDGDSEEFGFEFPELRHHLRIQSQLVAADGTPIRGIETEHHGPAEKIPERDMLIRGRLEGEVWRLGAGLQRRDLLVFRLELSHFIVSPSSLTAEDLTNLSLARLLTSSATSRVLVEPGPVN